MGTPRFSIVIPTCSRVEALATALDLLDAARQGVEASQFEIIVSDDSTRASAAGVLASQFPKVRFVDGPRRGPAANRNAGAQHARGEWLVFIDDDCQPADGWLRAIVATVEARPLDVVEGKVVPVPSPESIFRRDVENLNGDCYWSANLAVRQEYFEQIGRFDEDFGEAGGEDLELAHRFRTQGARVAFCAAAIVVHPPHVMSWRQMLAFMFRIRWHVLYRLKTRQAPPPGTPPWKVILALVTAEGARLLRTTRKSIASIHRRPLGTILARIVLDWALFPITLPYLGYWELRFRRQLRAQRLR